ncbi:unnamed protein product [Ophioblennius macclurei]
MADKQRALPSWMSKRQEEVKQPLKSRRKRKVARAAFYCMNEKELVEAAISCLTDDDRQKALLRTHQQDEEKPKDTPQKKDEPIILQRAAKLVTSDETTDCSEDLDETCVSETDLDITEQETLPYAESGHHAGSKGRGSEPDQDRGQLTNLETEKIKEQSQTSAGAAEDDDAIRLVREIFFT